MCIGEILINQGVCAIMIHICTKERSENMNINKDACAICGGKCCKMAPCLISTRDCKNGVEQSLKERKLNNSITIYAFKTVIFMNWLGNKVLNFFINNPNNHVSLLEQFYNIAERIWQYDEVYIVRMRSINDSGCVEFVEAEAKIEHFIRSGQCVKLLSSGCEYSDDERPYGGLSLIPDEQGRGIEYCKETYSVLQNADEWLPYHEIIRNLFFGSSKTDDT